MRKVFKLLHTLAACGLIGALLGHAVVLTYAPQDTAAAYAGMRATISALSNYILLPSLGVALVTGLLSMASHPPFHEMRWVWIKALLGFSMFESTLAVVVAKANNAASVSRKIANGEADAGALDAALQYEWHGLVAIMTLSLANVVLGVWRPRMKRRTQPQPA